MNAVELSLLAHRLNAVCDEMGAQLRRSALSPNIKDREDFSCALFDAAGELVAQAAHIPVHLGSMTWAMREVAAMLDWRPGDVAVFNDPFLGGTHLPDITVVAPAFADGRLLGFSAARAHHADVGGVSPGSMGLQTRLEDEGVVLPPAHWFRAGREQPETLRPLLERVGAPAERLGDLAAQRAAAATGVARLLELQGETDIRAGMAELLDASEAWGRRAVADIPDGVWRFEDALEDDGLGHGPLPIRVAIAVRGEEAEVDFEGSAPQSPGPVNCPLSVTAAAVFYVFRCLMPAHAPQTAGIFRPVRIRAPEGSLVNARPGAAVAAGNVETSQRIVDAVLGALARAMPERIPAAAQGTMNNVLFSGEAGGARWTYYETLGGGMGAHAGGPGLSAVQCHMTNTRNTSIEVLEMHYPLRVRRYAIRGGSGGCGARGGGDGLVREWEALADCRVSLLTERRASRPWGLEGGEDGAAGRNRLKAGAEWRELPAKGEWDMRAGDVLRVETPGGGGHGDAGEAA